MCSCRQFTYTEIMYSSYKGKQYPYHKNCGDWLSEPQKKKYEEEKIKGWEADKRRDITLLRETVAKISKDTSGESTMSKCIDCGSLVSSTIAYCPSCKSTQLEYINIK